MHAANTLSVVQTQVGTRPIQSGRWVQVAYVLTDVCFVAGNALLAYSLRFGIGWLVRAAHKDFFLFLRAAFRQEDLGFLLLYACLVVLFCKNRNLYRTPRGRSALDESLAVIQSVILTHLVLTAFIHLTKQDLSRAVIDVSGILNAVSLAGWRLWKRRVVERRIEKGLGVRNVLIVGAGRIGSELASYLEAHKNLGYVVRGFLDQNGPSDPRVLGGIEDLAAVSRSQFIDEIFITIPWSRELVKSAVLEARRIRLDVKVLPDLFDGLAWKVPFDYVGDFPVMALYQQPIPALGLLVKRTMDILFSGMALATLAPLLMAIAVAIRLDSRGSALYCSKRIGKKGRQFNCYKFRTMVVDADARKEELRRTNQRQGPFFKIANDPRLTQIGPFLRKYSLDELPQFWNVFKGDLSLVGPRPHPLDDCARYKPEHLRRLDVTPGLTGLWQISARRDPSFDTNMALDLEYIESWNLWMDIKILLRTLPVVLQGQGL
jgi:exopolysaccharide biosynthesis polyprenyl glycosylphosphotransferase